jgi:hypothetical protein
LQAPAIHSTCPVVTQFEISAASAAFAFQRPTPLGIPVHAGQNSFWFRTAVSRKYSPFVLAQISSSMRRPTRQEGRLAIVTKRAVGCGGRDGLD